MKTKTTSDGWRMSPLFSGISDVYLDQIKQVLVPRTYADGQYIIKDQEEGDCLYVIEKGEVEIQKKAIKIGAKKQGEHFGVMAQMDNSVRSADVLAKNTVIVQTLTANDLKTFDQEEVYFKVLSNHIAEQQLTVRKMNDLAVTEMKQKLENANKNMKAVNFFVTIVCWLIFYELILGLFIEYSSVLKNKSYLDVLNPMMIFLLGLAAFIKAYKSEYSMASYGLNLDNWKKNIIEALTWTFFFLIGLIFVKWLLTLFVPYYQGKPIIDVSIVHRFPSMWVMFIIYITYSFVAPVQEFIFRGVIQGNLEKFLIGKNRVFLAIFISNLIFSSCHIHYDIKFAIMTMIPGIFWGILYHRQKSLLGVGISHIIIGLFTLICMGLL